MAHNKNHDFHILPPSIWPFLSSVGVFVMFAGSVLWLHDKTPSIFFVGLGLVLYVMFGWWSDVNREGRAGDHTNVVQIGIRYGIILFILSEVMFFVAWFWSFFKHAIYPMQGVWPPEGILTFDPWHLPLINTLILLTSGSTLTWAHHALINGDRKGLINGLTLTVGLGIIFTVVQAIEYHHAAFGFSGNIYGANFFMATGFHGFHVIVGTIFLAICLMRAKRGSFSKKHHLGFEAAAWYWHFVDVVWLFLYLAIYIWGGGAVHAQ